MSHFTVLVIGENPEEQLAPFDENLRTSFRDNTIEYQEEYESKSVPEFFCDSHSSWGMRITKELYDILRSSKRGRVCEYDVTKIDPMSYFKRGQKYKGYYLLKDGKRCRGSQWFEVENVVQTTHPDPDVCFEGKIRIRKISPPKTIPLKEKYPIYEDYLRDWQGCDDIERQGYDFNPDAKWDWYQLGGRWAGFFTLKPGTAGQMGTRSWTNEDKPVKPRTADQARKKDIDFEQMAVEQYDELNDLYDSFEEEYAKGEMNPGTGYFQYGVENKGDKENYVPETREQFLMRQGGISTFAVLKDGQWYEKGEMGWWGIVSDEKEPDKWGEEFNKLLDELPEDTLLSLYDCHI